MNRHTPLRAVPIFLVALVSFACLAACAHPPLRLDRAQEVRPATGEAVRIAYSQGNEWDARLIASAMTEALQRLEPWGTLRDPVDVIVYPSHADLTRILRLRGYTWLRAWAQYDRVHFQAPSTWGGPTSARRVQELVTHELTHVVMYQTIGNRENWMLREIPLWFREGLASVVAQQGYRRLSVAQIRQASAHLSPGSDPIDKGDVLAKKHKALVYSLGHHMMEDLLEQCRPEGVRRIMETMGEGASFSESFDRTCPENLDTFRARWRERLSAS